VICVVWESHEQSRAEVGSDTEVWADVVPDVLADVRVGARSDEFDLEGLPRVVRRGEESEIVAAFAQAQRNSAVLWRVLRRLGLAVEVTGLAAGVSEDNRPLVRLRLTRAGLRALRRLLAVGPAPPDAANNENASD
jgi:hypothetical protein